MSGLIYSRSRGYEWKLSGLLIEQWRDMGYPWVSNMRPFIQARLMDWWRIKNDSCFLLFLLLRLFAFPAFPLFSFSCFSAFLLFRFVCLSCFSAFLASFFSASMFFRFAFPASLLFCFPAFQFCFSCFSASLPFYFYFSFSAVMRFC